MQINIFLIFAND